jgi:hypothetical protein
MKVSYWVNANLRDKYFEGYRPSDLVVRAGVIEIEAGDDRTVCERAFALLNRDDRPFGQTAPSMSVGDVVEIDDIAGDHDRPGHRYYAVEPMGFRRLLLPPIEFWPEDTNKTCFATVCSLADSVG